MKNNMTTKTTTFNLNIAWLPLLFIVMFVLKVLGYLTWSWWWITAPIWGPIALFFTALAFVIISGLIGLVVSSVRINREKKKYRDSLLGKLGIDQNPPK